MNGKTVSEVVEDAWIDELLLLFDQVSKGTKPVAIAKEEARAIIQRRHGNTNYHISN